jgi:pimeloyl-ACP methyl ester carboxylesterase
MREVDLALSMNVSIGTRGYAFASTDKGNSGPNFFRDGRQPGDAIAEWHVRVTELTRAATEVVRQPYGREPDRTYVTGVSNGGYLTRYALEQHPELYDGGVDWEGTLFRAEGPNLLTYLPAALRHYPAFRDTGDEASHAGMLARYYVVAVGNTAGVLTETTAAKTVTDDRSGWQASFSKLDPPGTLAMRRIWKQSGRRRPDVT